MEAAEAVGPFAKNFGGLLSIFTFFQLLTRNIKLCQRRFNSCKRDSESFTKGLNLCKDDFRLSTSHFKSYTGNFGLR